MIDKGVCLFGQLWELLLRGGFCFIKWISNDRNVIVIVLVMERVFLVVNLDLEDFFVECILGVQWVMEIDDFNFYIMDGGKVFICRGILFVVSFMYDFFWFMVLLFCQLKVFCRVYVSRGMVGIKIFDVDFIVW